MNTTPDKAPEDEPAFAAEEWVMYRLLLPMAVLFILASMVGAI